jgi:hypothetical protein
MSTIEELIANLLQELQKQQSDLTAAAVKAQLVHDILILEKAINEIKPALEEKLAKLRALV